MKSEAQKKAAATYREKNRERLREYTREYAASLKLEVFTHYGLACANCGFNDLRALSIDHIGNDGNLERADKPQGSKFSGGVFYRDLKKRGFPEGYQTLCMNCNFIKHVEYNLSKRENTDS